MRRVALRERLLPFSAGVPGRETLPGPHRGQRKLGLSRFFLGISLRILCASAVCLCFYYRSRRWELSFFLDRRTVIVQRKRFKEKWEAGLQIPADHSRNTNILLYDLICGSRTPGGHLTDHPNLEADPQSHPATFRNAFYSNDLTNGRVVGVSCRIEVRLVYSRR
jgi:hypothetical protein